MELLAPILSALLGSAGLSSLIASWAGRGREQRMVARLENLRKIQASMDPASYIFKVTGQAMETESLRISMLSLQRRSVLARSGRSALMVTISAMMLLLIVVKVLEFFWADDKPYSVVGLIGASLIVVSYIVVVGFVMAVIERYEDEREFYKVLASIPVIVETPEVRRAKRYQRIRARRRKKLNKYQDRKWARVRGKVLQQKHIPSVGDPRRK
ncbi:hypothetical protein [Glutamicibacter sp. TV12E]|uniref:hypothetical protein n=1 Tax=Glutamicibacter sp. TV12E TaxID=3446362 RepID=UPI004033C50E